MEAKVTYLYHSCFSLTIGEKVLLFDYPGPSYCPGSIEKTITSEIEDKHLYVLFSHSHPDHFDPRVIEFTKWADRTDFIAAEDAYEQLKMRAKDHTVVRVSPGETYPFEGLEIETFESNDEGVAFIIDIGNRSIYYGGDLAKWDWEEWDEEKRSEKVQVFQNMLKELKKIDPQIAFSNMDERLKSWAGPIEFLKQVRPPHFVPMHTFGNEQWIDDLLAEDISEDVDIFHYEETGDWVFWNI